MNQTNSQKTVMVRFDLQRILNALLKKAWRIGIASVLAAVIVLAGTLLLITPTYEASAMFYVNNNSGGADLEQNSISSSDISAAKTLVNSYIVILKTQETMEMVIAQSNVDRSVSELMSMISAGAVNSTQVLKVVVTSPNPLEAAQIAEAISTVLPTRISDIIYGTSAKVVDKVQIPTAPSSPSYIKNTVLGLLIGMMLSVGAVTLREILDIRIRSEEDIAEACSYPVLVTVPDMTTASKGGAYGANKAKKTVAPGKGMQIDLIGPNISFSASEAYKLLRAKLQFSFADAEEGGRVIGISSAVAGEGKSLTAVNLAYALSELGKKVLLIDCDMRLPTLALKLDLHGQNGLSGYLAGQCKLEELIQYCGLKDHEKDFHVITAGQIPPNPVELLSSRRMVCALDALRKFYDYVILDCPPVGEVSDAVTVSRETDGMLLVVHQNHCDRMALTDAVSQLEFVGAKILGVIYNGAAELVGHYGKKYLHSQYEISAAHVERRGNRVK